MEVDTRLFDLLLRYGELQSKQMTDKQAVAEGLRRLFERALGALQRERELVEMVRAPRR
jgi:hypothetical protein